MTIEEIKKASDELFKSFRCGKTYRMGFETGVMWSDEHLQVPKIINKTMKITREQAKELLPVIQAFAEGEIIQYKNFNDEWTDIKENGRVSFMCSPSDYRIKPQQKYRPFETKEECWNEMHKHPDFGWVKCKDSKSQYHICAVSHGYISVLDADPSFFESFGRYEFLDGEPFGIKEE